MGWYVLHVKPRTEKKVSAVCARHDIPHYLPLRESVRICQRRKVVSHIPLFPSYLFVALEPESRLHVLRTNHILHMMESEDEARLLHELEQIRKVLAVNPRLHSDSRLAHGSLVRIKTGAFVGVEGHVETVGKKTSVRLNVELVGQSVVVEVDRDFIETLA